jgi:hypothetical protein
MIPMRTSTIFKSRWMALLWAAGILWLAIDVAEGAGPSADTANVSANASGQAADGEAAQQFSDAANAL